MFRKKKNDNVYEEPNQRIKQVKAKAKGLAGGIIGVFVVLYLLAGSIYSLKENEYAVITTFGVPKVVEESGIHFKIPYIQRLARVPKTINGFPIGFY